MPRSTQSAGIVVYRKAGEPDTGPAIEVLIVHPGGPFWRNKDDGAWSIPKGEYAAGDDPESTARRELQEEVGLVVTDPMTPLGSIRLRSGKSVVAWAVEADFDPSELESNTFTIEWPPRSGRKAEFPEVDAAMWATPAVAARKLNPAQVALVERLVELLKNP